MLGLVNLIRRKGPRAFPLTRQHDSVDCGPACLHMIARYHGRTFALQELRELAGMDRQGASLLGLGEAAGRLGLRALGVRATLGQLAERVPLPCVALWQQQHFVVVYGVRGDRVYVADPAGGLLTYPRDVFARSWLTDDGSGEGVLLLLEPTPAFFERTAAPEVRGGGLSLLGSYLGPHRRLLLQLGCGIGALTLLQLLLPFLTEALVDTGIGNQDLSFVTLILAAQLTLTVTRTAVEFIQSRIVLHVGTRVDVAMVSDFLAKLMRLPPAYFDGKALGDLMQRIYDHERVSTFLSNTGLAALLALFNLVLFGAVLAVYSGVVFAVFAGGSVLYAAYVALFLRRRKAMDYRRFDEEAQQQGLLFETLRGMHEIKLGGAEQQKRWRWERLQARLFRLHLRRLTLDQYQHGGSLLLNEAKNIVVTVLAVEQVIAGELSLGGLLAVQYVLGQLNGPLGQLIGFVHSTQDAQLGLERMNEVRALPDEEAPHHLRYLPARADLRLQGVTFRYGGPEHPPVFERLDLTLPYGRTTAIVGSSGSGKTTLLKLLLKFYDPQAGDVRVGDVNLKSVSPTFWRQQCGVVLQDGRLFSDTIARNIALGAETVDRARVVDAARRACIHADVEALPLGYETRVGADGVGLSQGQQQRLLIARALYRDPAFLFFDEATSALDAETERTLTENLQPFFEGRTVFVIAHRLSTVRRADQIVVLERGRIVEVGVHDDLVARRGRYYELIRNQLELGH